MNKFVFILATLMLFTGTVAAQNQNITADGKTEERPMTQAELEAKYQELQTKISEMELQSSEFQKKIELETGINIPKRRYINLSYVDQRVKFGAEDGMKSDYGAAFEWGRTFFFNGKRPVSTEIALMFEAVLGLEPVALTNMQNRYNMQVARKNKPLLERLAKIRRIVSFLLN